MIVADYIAARLIDAGVGHVFGVGGANIEDLFAAVQRRRPQMRAVLAKHEHGAGSAAAAYARIRGLGVVMTTSGGGAMNLVHAMAEAHASRLPVLALVGEPPSDVQGHGAFQDTSGQGGAVDAAAVFGAVSAFCRRVESAARVPELLAQALSSIRETGRNAVLLIAKDRQRAEIGAVELSAAAPHDGRRACEPGPLLAARAQLGLRPCVIIAGDEVVRASARPELEALAAALDAEVAVAPDARAAFDNAHPRFAGVAGAMGHARVKAALDRARICVLVGTRLPVLARMGLEARLRELRLVSIGREPPFVAGGEMLHLDGDVRDTLRRLNEIMPRPTHETPAEARTSPEGTPAREGFTTPAALAAVSAVLGEDDVVIVDAGNTGASAAHYLRAPKRGDWLMAMGMAGMGYAFGAAIGAALASGRRCYVLAGDGAFYMHGFEIHTAVEHELPITYLLFNNCAHGMCLVRERLLLDDNAGYNGFRRAHLAAGVSAMFPSVFARDCRSLPELAAALQAAAQRSGPNVIAIELDEVEVPPFVQFQAVDPALRLVSRRPAP